MHEIDFRTADYEDISTFAMNLLHVSDEYPEKERESRIAYYSTVVHAVLGRKAAESAGKLAFEIDSARIAVGRGLDKLELSINTAANLTDEAAKKAARQTDRMIRATWGLVAGTVLLAIATGGLVYYTRELVRVETHGSVQIVPTATTPGAK